MQKGQKQTKKKLQLHTETLRLLSDAALNDVGGGKTLIPYTTTPCKDITKGVTCRI